MVVAVIVVVGLIVIGISGNFFNIYSGISVNSEKVNFLIGPISVANFVVGGEGNG